MDKIREEFEAWYWNELYSDLNISLWGAIFGINRDGDYRGLECNTSWKAWQASRAALCVELPYSGFSEFYGDALHGYATAIDLVRDALIDAGVDGK